MLPCEAENDTLKGKLEIWNLFHVNLLFTLVAEAEEVVVSGLQGSPSADSIGGEEDDVEFRGEDVDKDS